jgi:hypothetical protein
MPYSFNPFSGNFDNTPSTLKGDTAYSNLVSNSATWVDAYETGTVYKANSASYATIDFTNNKFFPLTGGQITGNTRINGNVTIFGDLTSTGTQTFANTIFSTTSSLSVVHVGSGPAVWVGNNGSGDIASFYDMDQGVEVLHVGGANGDFPNVGVKTSSPNKDFTVNGEISSSSVIYDVSGNSTNWNFAYLNQTAYLPLSGGTVTGKLSAAADATSSKLNIGNAIVNPSPSVTVDGDVWITNQNKLAWKTNGNVVNAAGLSQTNTFNQQQIISAGTPLTLLTVANTGVGTACVLTAQGTSAALRITQTGTGNAIVVEDSTNPDATPFVVDALGSVGIGLSSLSSVDAKLTVVGNISSTAVIYASGGNSDQWNTSFTTVLANSAVWSSVVSYTKNFDYIANGIDYSYSGIAPEGTVETDPFWKITRLAFSDTGSLSATGIAQNVTWNERLTATYV